jgi:hypothetical protein
MANFYLIQLIGVILVIAGLIALMASTRLFGPRLSPAEKRMSSDEWNRRRDRYRWPINFETLAATLVLAGGVAILIWSKFDLCVFLAYWIPPLPLTVRLFLSCGR